MIKEVDPENRGTVEFTDFLGLMARKIKEVESEDQVNEAFSVFDKEGNGYISAQVGSRPAANFINADTVGFRKSKW